MDQTIPRLLRSWMFVPGDRQRMIDKALGLRVDAIMMDIEDGVASGREGKRAPPDRRCARSMAARLRSEPAATARRRATCASTRWAPSACTTISRPWCGRASKAWSCPRWRRPNRCHRRRRSWRRERNRAGAAGRIGAAARSPSKVPIGLFNAYAIASSSPRIIGLCSARRISAARWACPAARRRSARLSMPAPTRDRRRRRARAGGGRRVDRLKDGRAEALRASGPPSRHVGHVHHSSEPDRRGQRRVHADARTNRICRAKW